MWPPSAACPPWALLAAGAGAGVGSMAALVLAQCCLLRPPEFCRSEILASSLSNPPSWCKMWKTFFCCCLCLSVQCASPPFSTKFFFSFLIFFRLPKFLSSYIIHLEEAIHFKIFLLCTNLFRSPDKKD